MPRGAGLLLLSLIVATGIGLRFYGLGSRGLVLFDEAYYANAAKTPVYALEWLRDDARGGGGTPGGRPGLEAFLRERGAVRFPGKPGHVALLTVAFLLFGVHDWVVLGLSALAGSVTIVLVYLLGRRLFDERAALLAAAFFAASGNGVAFARTGYPLADAVALLTLATWCYARSLGDPRWPGRYLVAAGVAGGFGMLVHQTVAVAIPAFLATEVFAGALTGDLLRARRIRRLVVLTLCLVVPLPLVQAGYGLVDSRLAPLSAHYVSAGLLRATEEPLKLVQIQRARSDGWPGVFAENAGFLGEMLLRLETPLFLVGALAGMALLAYRVVRQRSAICLLLGLLVLLPFGYGVLIYATLKAIQVAMPALALGAGAAGAGLVDLVARRASPRPASAVLAVLAGAALLVGAVWARPWVVYRTGYQEMVGRLVAYMSAEGGTLSIPDQGNLAPLLAFYLGERVKQLPRGFRGRVTFTETGGDYVVVDHQRLLKFGPAPVEALRGLAPVIQVPNAPAMLPVFHLHRAVPSMVVDSYRTILACRPCDGLADVSVYDVRKLARP